MKHLTCHLLLSACILFAAGSLARAAEAVPKNNAVPADGTAVWELWLPPNGIPVRAVASWRRAASDRALG